ncbi:uncharacterized protein LAESUDRAFT_638886 [Laetiporus sulphureus 93-53]|uniref:Diphthine--ammonia ligase n=1 Tax=Laetiporus sulphureus 93-53 TaxID=1314785 RepID=A0A165I3A4_9APHY|nr:uncharacterized protein LAESUDRAFT_638886 [Laetiporus sulphureus 93-53]KZT12538.1 hypothetical protein LAESUDRAFT_638886 [Laetiporus sulphureus 93-53]
MKYVALLSGGKDSCYNLLHCQRNGHDLVAAASLGPEQGKEEIDSYLFQTVGQDAIEFVAHALDVPLYRKNILGAAVEQGSEYGGRHPEESSGVPGDETEDLHALLSAVKAEHPDIQGVAIGAILSNYQRVRMEHVCRRLGLTPLCYLWQRDQIELLSEMIEAGMEAVLIKVAGVGLKPEHLGKTLVEMRPTLLSLHELYGSHICGEGGEYETLTLDCPLFKQRIQLVETETVIHSDNDFAVVAYLRIKDAVLKPKYNQVPPNPVIPPLLTPDFEALRDAVAASLSTSSASTTTLLANTVESVAPPGIDDNGSSSRQIGRWVAITNITSSSSVENPEFSVEDEVRVCFQELQAQLSQYSLKLANCSIINIFLSSMDYFVAVNGVYATYFGTSPPARACVAIDLPPHTRVMLDCVAFAEDKPADRQALHVQGLSYWAPANIGPYSQAIIVDERVFISGQIGLLPSSLTLPAPVSLSTETALSFQHVERIVSTLKNNSGGGWEGHGQANLYWLAHASDVPHVKKASALFSKVASAPTLFLVVSALPKGALVEKQVLLHTGQYLLPDEEDELTMRDHEGEDGAGLHWEASVFSETTASVAMICVRGDAHSAVPGLHNVTEVNQVLSRALSIRLFYQPSRTSSFADIFSTLFAPHERPPVTYIPCRHISTRDHDDWDYAMVIIGA